MTQSTADAVQKMRFSELRKRQQTKIGRDILTQPEYKGNILMFVFFSRFSSHEGEALVSRSTHARTHVFT